MSSTTNSAEETSNINNWDEDKPFKLRIKKQNLVVISILKLSNGKQLFRLRGAFEEYNDAVKRVDELKKTDKASFIFIGEMGKWLAIYLDLPKMNSGESNERNDLLNNFMKQYKDSLYEEEQEEKKRKDELLKGATVVTGKHQETGIEVEPQVSEVVETKTPDANEDYLDEDRALRQLVKSQDFFNCSILNVQSFPENRREAFKDVQVWGLKIRGVYEVYSESAEKAEHLQKVDKYHNVFVGEVGKNYPADIDVSEMGSEDQVYREKSLGKYMKSTKGAVHEEEDKEDKVNNTTTTEAVSVDANTSSEVVFKTSDTSAALPTAQTIRTPEDNTENELAKNESERERLQSQLESTKASLVGLEDKLNTIHELYAKLKSE
jgi:hypothetical protein